MSRHLSDSSNVHKIFINEKKKCRQLFLNITAITATQAVIEARLCYDALQANTNILTYTNFQKNCHRMAG